MAFYLYVEPNIRSVFEFKVDSMATVATLDIDGNAGASYVGFYSDDPMHPLQFIYVDQTTMESDGFAVGEFGINVVPEPAACGLLCALGLVGFVASRRERWCSRSS